MNHQHCATTFTGLLFALTLTSNLHAITGCTNAYLQGSYGGQLSGTAAGVTALSAKSSSTSPQLGLTRLVFDGQGTVTGSATFDATAAASRSQITGTYSVNTDCTISLALTNTLAGQQNWNGVLVAGGDRVYLAQIDTAAPFSGSVERARALCTAADFNGSYGFRRSGVTLAASAGAANAAATTSSDSVGFISADGIGSFSLSESIAGSGSAGWNVSTGTYTIGEDCSVTLTFDASPGSGAAAVIQGTLTNNHAGLVTIETRSNLPVAGSFAAQ